MYNIHCIYFAKWTDVKLRGVLAAGTCQLGAIRNLFAISKALVKFLMVLNFCYGDYSIYADHFFVQVLLDLGNRT